MDILGYEYTIEPDTWSGKMGQLSSGFLKIKLDPSLPQQQRESTLLHEVIEAINSHLGLGLTHPQIMGLEAGLYQTLRANGVDLQPLLSEVQWDLPK